MPGRRDRRDDRTPKSATPGHAPAHAQRRQLAPTSNVRDTVEQLQRTAGNRAVARLMAQAQFSLTVGHAHDPLEEEADEAALEVVRSMRVQRMTVQRAPAEAAIGLEGGDLDTGTESALKGARSGGRALDGGLQRDLGGAMGADLSGVRVHTGAMARSLNDTMSARAFTVGKDIFFRDGMPDTGSKAGMKLLAHEVTHTVQQGASPLARDTDLDDEHHSH